MLATQVQYWTLQENKRHNIAMETLGNQQNTEVIRHNMQTERQQDINLAQAQQQIELNRKSINENIRHNKAAENITQWANYETKRHNLANEAVARTNAQASLRQAQAAEKNADTNRLNAYTNQRNAAANEMNARTSRLNSQTQSKLASIADYNAQTQRKVGNANVNLMNKNANAVHDYVIQGYFNSAANIANSAWRGISVLRGSSAINRR